MTTDRRERDGTHLLSVAAEGRDLLAGRNFPDLDDPFLESRSHEPPVGAERHGIDAIGWNLQRVAGFVGRRVPDSNRAVLRSGDEEPAIDTEAKVMHIALVTSQRSQCL